MQLLLAGGRVQREVADIELGAVCGKTGCNTGRYRGAQVTADGGSADQHDLGLVLVDDCGKSLSVRLCPVGLQLGIIDKDDAVCAVLAELIAEAFDIGTKQNCRHLGIQGLGQFFCFSDQLEGNTGKLTVDLLRKYKYALVIT